MNSLLLLLVESSSLILLTGLLVLLSNLRHAPEGFQHLNAFFYGTPPAGFIPVESSHAAPSSPSDWR